MGERNSFLNQHLAADELAVEAALHAGSVKHPLVRGIDRVHTAILGLGEILRIVQESAERAQDCHDGHNEAPLSAYSVDALLGLGAVVTDMISGDLERITKQVDERLSEAERPPHKGGA
jgi:hypothetical protein